jgi:hypothetical protein
MLQIDDPLVEKMHAILVGHSADDAFGAVNRLQRIMYEYHSSGKDPIPEVVNSEIPSIPAATDEVSEAMALAKESLDQVVRLRDA